MFYGDFVSNFFSLDSILFALFDILTLFQGRLINIKIEKLLKVVIFKIKDIFYRF
ncbi:hypothetical protein LEP1GSC087_1731 [Leptospira interrogans serovar Bataviae str. L1111]|nr:hypothetical protein LEP1GSC087_1731 [Leptospira interrogans serovar Bataviae str. L1111]